MSLPEDIMKTMLIIALLTLPLNENVAHQPDMIILAIIVEITVLWLLGLTTWHEKRINGEGSLTDSLALQNDLDSRLVIDRLQRLMQFPRSKVMQILGDADTPADERVHMALTVDVVSPPDRPAISVADLVTAAGYPTSAIVQVHGASPSRASAAPEIAIVTDESGRPCRARTFSRPGRNRTGMTASDTRGDAVISRAGGFFNVEVLEPIPRSEMPEQIFAHETAEVGLAVAGLEEMDRYAWIVTQDGLEKARGAGVRVRCKPDAAGVCVIRATYGGKECPVKGHGPSVFTIEASEPPVRIILAPIAPSENHVVVEDAGGDDLLDGEPRFEVAQGHTALTFFLKGKVSRDGTEATIHLRVGTTTKLARSCFSGMNESCAMAAKRRAVIANNQET
jgi:hypothetical protein